jgi:carotenoid cleavage dioxygenase
MANDIEKGWLIGFVIDAERNTTDLVILSARNVEGAPPAGIRTPHIVQPDFNGNWLQSVR